MTIYKNDNNSCNVSGCTCPPSYLLEWYGVDQHGRNPEVVLEIAVCDDYQHIDRCADNESLGRAEGIVDIVTYEDVPGLLDIAKDGLQTKIRF